jgi:RHS repeat-associated protein
VLQHRHLVRNAAGRFRRIANPGRGGGSTRGCPNHRELRERPRTPCTRHSLVEVCTYSYDTNPYDCAYSQYSAGRLTAIQYAAINYDVVVNEPAGSTTFTDMFTYAKAGQVAGKRLRVTKVQPYGNGLNHTQTAVGDLDLAYGYNQEGQLSMATYPTDVYGHTPSFNYSFDPMMRPAGMTDQSGASVVTAVDYGAANELKHMTYNGGVETRVYNSMLQLTSISGLGQSINYTFPAAGSNAGKILSQTDTNSGETVAYLYDSLKRLTSATASGWQQNYTYDGFGNLTARAGTGTAQSTTINTPADTATNRLSGYTYDFNGNQISTGYAYDAENRLVQANAGAVQYAYDGQNKRIWQATFSNCSGDWCLSSDSISLFGIDGKQIGTYTAGAAWNNTQNQIALSFYSTTQRVYFGRKLVATLDWQGTQHGVVQDRLESVGKYYPFGEERNSPPLANDQVKFATYTRDSATGLDYADQRYYTSAFGRFMSPDPYRAMSTSPSNPANPLSWNRYAYVTGDPVNKSDPQGLRECYVTDDNGDEVDCSKYDPSGVPTINTQGGGGGKGPLTVTNFSNSGDNQQEITDVLNDILSGLSSDTKCSDWLQVGTGGSISDLISTLISNNSFGHASFSDNTVAAFAGSKNADGTPSGAPITAAITVNDNGGFYNSTISVNGVDKNVTIGPHNYQGGSLKAQAAILLHELGHIENAAGGASGFQSDAGNAPAGKANDKLVDQNCGKLIGGLQ